MRKKWLALLMMVVLLFSCGTAFAQTTGFCWGGREYVVYAGVTQFEADGKTFIIGEDTVIVKESGKPDQVFPLYTEYGERIEAVPDATSHQYIASICVEAYDYTASSETEFAKNVYTRASDVFAVQAVSGLQYEQMFSAYEKYGLHYDAKEEKLYYNEIPVRVFTDEYAIGNVSTMIEHINMDGTIDVETIRDMTKATSLAPCGELIGLRQLTDEEFLNRDLSHLIQEAQMTCSGEGELLTPAEKQKIYAEYEPLGLMYDAQTDTLSYLGMEVKQFLDVRSTNGELMTSGKFEGCVTMLSFRTGKIRVETIRDYKYPNENGEGKLIGLIYMMIAE